MKEGERSDGNSECTEFPNAHLKANFRMDPGETANAQTEPLAAPDPLCEGRRREKLNQWMWPGPRGQFALEQPVSGHPGGRWQEGASVKAGRGLAEEPGSVG